MRDSREALPPRARSIQLRHAYQGEPLSHRRATRRIFAVANDGDSGVYLPTRATRSFSFFRSFFFCGPRDRKLWTRCIVDDTQITLHGEIGRSPARNSLSIPFNSCSPCVRQESRRTPIVRFRDRGGAAVEIPFIRTTGVKFFRNEISPTRSTRSSIFFLTSIKNSVFVSMYFFIH